MDNDIIGGGCILLSRQILKSDIWRKPPEYLKIFLHILLNVNHTDGKFPRGSNFFNFADSKPSGVTKDQIYKFLAWSRRKDVNILATQKTTRGIIIKVNNYDKYQSLENYKRQDTQQDNGNTPATQEQDNGNTINNNDNNDKKENNIINIGEKKKFTPPTLEEIKDYCLKRKNGVDPQRFFDYYEAGGWKDSKGKPIKSWKQKMIAVWEDKTKGKSSAPQNSKKENFYMSLSK